MKILFVCHGNICRSPIAESLFNYIAAKNNIPAEAESAATSREETGNDIYPGAKNILRAHGIPFEKRAARQMDKSDYNKFDYIIGMEKFNVRNILRILGSDPESKVRLLSDFTDSPGRDIADPWYTDDFETAYRDILKGVTGLLESVENA